MRPKMPPIVVILPGKASIREYGAKETVEINARMFLSHHSEHLLEEYVTTRAEFEERGEPEEREEDLRSQIIS